ncbi:U3 small nucleolar RNA-associated protein 23 [Pancytospora epiphaga]|nr:U3 small nucleolar RNA-associated protein 23 [Pancytospora epiphaga]
MKETNAKKNKQAVKILESNGFRKPYQILVDSSFVAGMNKLSEPISQIQHVLRDQPKLFIPKCEFEKQRPSSKGRDTSGQCEILKCTHTEENSNCIELYIRDANRHHYILGTNTPKVLRKFWSAAIPVIKIKNSQIVIDTGKMERKTRTSGGTPASKKELKRLSTLFGDVVEEKTEEE